MELDDLISELEQVKTYLAETQANVETAETVETEDDYWANVEAAREAAKACFDALNMIIDEHMP